MEKLLTVSPCPHVKSKNSANMMQQHMIVALLVLIAVASVLNGYRVVLLALISLASAFFTELIYNKLVYEKNGVDDWSCTVSALMFTCLLGDKTPLYVPVIGMVFAVVIVKMVFGGFANNMFNVEAAGFVFAVLVMNVCPDLWISSFGSGFALNPSENLAAGEFSGFEIGEFMLGNVTSTIGSICAIALIVAIVYLFVFKVIRIRMPIIALTVYLFVALIINEFDFECVLPYIFGGNILFVSFFMLTDFTTSPNSVLGRIIYAVIFGALSAVFVSINLCGFAGTVIALLISNCFTPLFDRIIRPRYFGEGK